MSIEERITNFLERKLHGPDRFVTEAAVLRTLIKFFEDHQSPVPTDSPLRKCLTALEAGEKSSAIEAYKRINRGGMWGIGDWIPPVSCQCETPESVAITFTALVGTWLQLMSALEKRRG